MTANDDAARESPLPWWHQGTQSLGDADSSSEELLTSATDELVRLLASLGDWVKVGGGTRARTTWDSASRVLGGSVRPEVVEHLQAAAMELAAAVQAAVALPHVDDSDESRDHPRPTDDDNADDDNADDDNADDDNANDDNAKRVGDRDAKSSSSARVQRINLD